MPPDDRETALVQALAATAAESDRTGDFPWAAFGHLRDGGYLDHPPIEASGIARLLRMLSVVGRGDLSVGRIYEGHVNALLLIATHAAPGQRDRMKDVVAAGGLLGVWNTDLPGDPLRISGEVLHGAKTYASGIEGLSHAVVPFAAAAGRQMLLVPVGQLRVDRSWWQPMGMRASGSHIARFDALAVESEWMLGGPDAYLSEPCFSGGAIRFAAVQAGGMHGILDIVAEHLRRSGRLADPYQLHRLARMGIAVGTAYGWLVRAAAAWRSADENPDALLAVSAATRCAVEAAAIDLLDEAERAVGAAGFNAPHPLERRVRDLRTYLRQPNPDASLAALGTAIGDGGWRPCLPP